MSAATFIDTSYILALVNTGDQWHASARTAANAVPPPFVTTESVLVEIGNALARARWRSLGIAAIQDLRADPDIEVVPVDGVLFDHAVDLYASRPDKEWGLTDCISFIVMQERGLAQALTTDRHFEQAGFESALLSPGR
jgi:predicted nucleic acid-binding protein